MMTTEPAPKARHSPSHPERGRPLVEAKEDATEGSDGRPDCRHPVRAYGGEVRHDDDARHEPERRPCVA